MEIVLEASVLIKWLLNDPEREPDTEKATALVLATGRGEFDLILPSHWPAEKVGGNHNSMTMDKLPRCWHRGPPPQ